MSLYKTQQRILCPDCGNLKEHTKQEKCTDCLSWDWYEANSMECKMTEKEYKNEIVNLREIIEKQRGTIEALENIIDGMKGYEKRVEKYSNIERF